MRRHERPLRNPVQPRQRRHARSQPRTVEAREQVTGQIIPAVVNVATDTVAQLERALATVTNAMVEAPDMRGRRVEDAHHLAWRRKRFELAGSGPHDILPHDIVLAATKEKHWRSLQPQPHGSVDQLARCSRSNVAPGPVLVERTKRTGVADPLVEWYRTAAVGRAGDDRGAIHRV